MPKRRANGEGNIRKRKDGRWEGRYTVGRDPETGKAIIKNVLGKTQAEVKEKLKKAIEENVGIDYGRAKTYTVGNWLEVWYENYAKIKMRHISVQFAFLGGDAFLLHLASRHAHVDGGYFVYAALGVAAVVDTLRASVSLQKVVGKVSPRLAPQEGVVLVVPACKVNFVRLVSAAQTIGGKNTKRKNKTGKGIITIFKLSHTGNFGIFIIFESEFFY